MLPAWVNEPAPTERYAGHEGEDQHERRSRDRRPRDKRGLDRKRSRPGFDRPTQKGKMSERRRRQDRPGFVDRQPSGSAARTSDRPLPPIAVKFLPRVSAFENVVAQIKSGSV